MVYKIRIAILVIIFICLVISGITHKNHIETNLLKTLIPKQIINSKDIISIANKSSSLVKVVFEADNQYDLEKLKQKFIEQTDTDYFELNKQNIKELLDKYLQQPGNFLSKETKKLLTEKNYNEIYYKSIGNLYNPSKIQLSTFDKDPYLLLDEFIFSNIKISNSIDYLDGKYYDYLQLKIKNNEALSPSLSSKKIKQLINIQKNLSNKNSKIYLCGASIHAYYASIRSIIDINIICILSTLMIIFLTYRYFKNLKLLLPIALSIIFGMLCAYTATKLLFDSFQIITMVFSTTLTGIGIDYSYHYFFMDEINKKFVKNLSFSLLTTIIPFILLYYTGIELLEQIAIFTIFGLAGIYFIILFIYPCFKYSTPVKIYIPKLYLYKIILIILCIFALMGLGRLKFNDNLTALYSPSKELSKSEALYSKISGENINTQIITVQGENINEIIEREENITQELDKNNIEYISLSKFFPSEKKQFENFNLIKDLYKNNLYKYSNILSKRQINNLKNKKFIPVKFDNIYLKDLMLDVNTSMIIVFNKKHLSIKEKNAYIINLQSDISYYMKHYRNLLLMLLPIVIFLMYITLTFLYNYKKAFKILMPSITGIVSSVLLTALIYGELNLFSIITIFLVLGFTVDYSIFRINREEKTESAVFLSCITTSFSFLLLALCGFKMLSSIALVLFFGIITSYLSGYLLSVNHDKI